MKGGCSSEGEIVGEDRTDKVDELCHVELQIMSIEDEINHVWMRWVLRSFFVGSEASDDRVAVKNKNGVQHGELKVEFL